MSTTADIIVDALVANGVDTVFGIPGAHTYELTDALARRSNEIRFIHTRHEQGAAYMAYGYARASGRPGVFTVVPGPGILNAAAALCTAYGANAPVMCLTGNIMSDLIGQGRGQLHELPDQLATLRGLTKWSERINHPSEAGEVMQRAFSEMQSGRPRPVAVEAPWDVFGQTGTEIELMPAKVFRPGPIASEVAAAAELISSAKNPMIMVGGGALNAAPEVLELARRISAPVVSHRSGKGIVPDDSPSAMNLVAGYDYWQKCDLLIGIGSRLELPFMRWKWKPENLKVVRIDIDPTEMVRLKPDRGIVADATEGVRALLGLLRAEFAPDRSDEFACTKNAARGAIDAVQPQMSYLDAIRSALPRDGFFTEEVCQIGFTARFGFPVYSPRQYVTCGYQDNLGFGFNTALGVKVAHPEKAVVSVSGDGGFMFGAQELATAVQHGINVVCVVFNNKAYGNVHRDQISGFDGRMIGSELSNPDFVALARSFGAQASQVASPEALGVAVEEALAADAPVLIEVDVATGSEASPWPLLHPAPHNQVQHANERTLTSNLEWEEIQMIRANNSCRQNQRGLVRRTIAAAFLLCGLAVPVHAEPIELIYNIFIPAQAPIVRDGLLPWAQDVEAASNGTLKLTIPSASVAPVPQLWDAVEDGLADIALVVNASRDDIVTLPKILNIPLADGNAEQASVALWETHLEYFAAANEFGDLIPLTTFVAHGAQMMSSRKPVVSPEDLQGLKVRVGSGTQVELLKAMGASPINKSANQAFELLSGGIADASLDPFGPAVSQGQVGISNEITLFPGGFSRSGFTLVINRAKFDSLPEEAQRALVETSGTALAAQLGEINDREEVAGRTKFEEAGATIRDASPEFIEFVREISSNIRGEWLEDAEARGVDGEAALAYYASRLEAAKMGN